MKSWLPSVFALAAVSCVVAIVLALRAGPMSPAAATFLAAAVPAMLAPLFWLREGYARDRLLQSALAPVLAMVVVALGLRIAVGASAAPGPLALAGLVIIAMLTAAHQAAALVEDTLRRLGAGDSLARDWSYWTVTAVLWLAAAAPLWLGPLADLFAGARPRLPTFVLGSSPLAHLAAAAGYDILRGQWFYAHSSLGGLQVDYPRLPLLLSAYIAAAIALTLVRAGQARLLGGLAAVVLALGLAGAAQAADPLDVEVIPAWDGWSRPGRVTEVEVRLRSQRSEAVEVVLTAGSASVRTRVALDAGQHSINHVPLRAAETITTAVRRNGKQRANLESRLSLSESPLLAWVAPLPAAGPFGGFHPVAIEPEELPRTAAAYSSIDALVIDRRLMSSLDQRQLAALLSHVASCGRTIVVSPVAPADEGLFRAAVGCGGRAFATVTSAGEVASSLATIAARSTAPPLAALSLATVMGPDLRVWYAITALLAASAAAIVIGAVFTSSLASAIAVPALLAAGSLWFVQVRAPQSRLTVWAEAGVGERVAQYQGLLQTSELRRGSVRIPVPDTLARPQTCHDDDRATWEWDAVARRFSAVKVEGRLFGRASLCFAGEFPVARAAVMRLAGDDRMTPGNAAAASSGAQALALSRTPVDAHSILWPLDLGRVQHAPAQSQAWLLMRVDPSEQG